MFTKMFVRGKHTGRGEEKLVKEFPLTKSGKLSNEAKAEISKLRNSQMTEKAEDGCVTTFSCGDLLEVKFKNEK